MNDAPSNPSPLVLLARVNLLQALRKLQAAARQSRLLTLSVGGFIAAYFAVAYFFFNLAFNFVQKFPGLGTLLTERLIYLLFACLFMLLLFSNLVIAYTNLFRNREATFLMTMPVSHETVFLWKFIESMALASWAFVFLISPFLLAYGNHMHVAWHFYPVSVAIIVVFIVLPGTVGAWCAVQLARFMDRRSFQIVLIGTVLVLGVFAVVWLRPEYVTDASLEYRVMSVMDRLMAKTEFAQATFLPSYWLSNSVIYWAENAVRNAGFFVLILLSYALFFGVLLCTRMGAVFYDGASAVLGRSSILGNWKGFARAEKLDAAGTAGPLERLVGRLFFLRPDTRALMVKDMRLFWRDTTQWGQSLVLFGLLAVYVVNIRQFSQQLTNPFWLHLIAFMNLGACSLNLATLTTRFVYPQFSLEGKRLWIMGMAPMGFRKVVMVKFWMAGFAALAITLTLVASSCYMLKMPAMRIGYFSLAITVMTFALTGLAVGLGVLYPNFKEENPGKIVSGFGGTFCLVISFAYIVASVIALGAGSPKGIYSQFDIGRSALFYGLFLVVSGLVGWFPMRLAMRRLRTLEI